MKLLVIEVFLVFISCCNKFLVFVNSENIQALGCWKDNNVKRALPLLENNHPLLLDSYKKRPNPIIKCAQVANQKGFPVFALQNGGQCFGGPDGEKTFEMYGPSNLCKGGIGGRWSNNVYSTQTFYRRTVHETVDPSPWDPYCTRDLDMVILLDGSGSRSSKTVKRRWNAMLEFTQKFVKGFDTHARLGIIEYGSDVKIPIDMLKAAPPEKLAELVKNIELTGGRRSLNDALKAAWRDQLKDNNRTSADRVIVALTTGNVPYGLYGSSQFLSDHMVRVVAVGVDRDVNYEFLQSIASYRDVKNIFSVNHDQLGDIAPYVYRDICNTFPEYVSEPKTTQSTTIATTATPETTTTTTTPTTAAQLTPPPTTTTTTTTFIPPPKSNNQNKTSTPLGDSSGVAKPASNATKGAGRDDIISIPLSALANLPINLLGQKKNKLPQVLGKDGAINKKTDVLTILDPNQPKERLASMVLINPKPELNLDLTKQELAEIQNRRHHKEEPEESLADALNKYKKLLKDEKNSSSKLTPNVEKDEKEFTSSQDEFYGHEDKKFNKEHDDKNGFPPHEENGEKENKANGDGSNIQSVGNYNSSHSSDSNELINNNKGPLAYQGNHESNAKDEETKASMDSEKETQKESTDKEAEKEKENKKPTTKGKEKKKGKNFKGEESKFKPKFIPQTKSESPSAPTTNDGEMKKITDKTSSDKPGVLSQTMEYHSGNGKEHVDEHPQHQVDYDKMFDGGKLQNKMKNRKNRFFDEKLYQQQEQHQQTENTSKLIASAYDLNGDSNNHWNSGTLSPMASEGFFPEDLGLTPINDQYETAAVVSGSEEQNANRILPSSGEMTITSSVTAASTKTDIAPPAPKSDDKIMGLLGEIEQAAQQTAQMAQEELKKINDGGDKTATDVPGVVSKRVLEIKSKKIDALLSSLHSAKGRELQKKNPKLEVEATQLKDVIKTLGDLVSSKSSKHNRETNEIEARNSFRRDIKNKDQRRSKSLLEFNPVKVIKSKIEVFSNKTNVLKDPKALKYRSFIKSFEEHLEDMTTLAGRSNNIKNKKMASQKHEINHMFHIKSSDNVTSFPYNLPFATGHAPSPIIPSSKHGPVHPFKDLSVAHLSPWLHSPTDFPLRHAQDDIQISDMQVQDILLQPEPIIGPARSNTNAKPSVGYSNNKKYQNQIQPRHEISPSSRKGYSDLGNVVLEDTDTFADSLSPLVNDEHQQFGDQDQTYEEGETFPETNLLDAPSETSILKQDVSFDDFPPVNYLTDLSPSSPANRHVMGPSAPKNPVLIVSSSKNVSLSHNEVIDKDSGSKTSPQPKETKQNGAQGKTFDHLNLNTLTKKTHTPPKVTSPKPPSLPEMVPMHQFASKPFGHLKPIRPRPDFKKRPLMKDHKSKDATRLMKHVKKKSEVKKTPTSSLSTTTHQKTQKQQHSPAPNSRKRPTGKTKRKSKVKSKMTGTTSMSAKRKKPISPSVPVTKQLLKNQRTGLMKRKNSTTATTTNNNNKNNNNNSTTTTDAATATAKNTVPKASSSSANKSIEYNQSLSIVSKGRSVHFRTSPEDSKTLMNGIVQKKGKIDVRRKVAVTKESDFPKIFQTANFSLNDLPLLTKGRSYVLTTEEKGTVKVSINGTDGGSKTSSKSKPSTRKRPNTTTTKSNNHFTTKDNKQPKTSLLKIAEQNKQNKQATEAVVKSNKINTTRASSGGKSSLSTRETKKMKTEIETSSYDDNMAKLEKEKDKLTASLAGLRMLENSQQPLPANPSPQMQFKFNNSILADTDDTQAVTHDFTAIKNIEERVKTVAEVLKQNGSVVLAADDFTKHIFIPNHTVTRNNSKNQTVINETLATKSSSNLTATNSTMQQEALATNSTRDSQEQQRQVGQDKLMTYIKGMSKPDGKYATSTDAADDRNGEDYEVSNGPDKAEEKSMLEKTNKSVKKRVSSLKNETMPPTNSSVALASNHLANESTSTSPSDTSTSPKASLSNTSNPTTFLSNSSTPTITTSASNPSTIATNKTVADTKKDVSTQNVTETTSSVTETTKKHEAAVDLEKQNRMESDGNIKKHEAVVDLEKQNRMESDGKTKKHEAVVDREKQNRMKSGGNIKKHEAAVDLEKQNRMESDGSSKVDEKEIHYQVKMTNNSKVANKTVETEDELRQGTADHQQPQPLQQQQIIPTNITKSQSFKASRNLTITADKQESISNGGVVDNLRNVTRHKVGNKTMEKSELTKDDSGSLMDNRTNIATSNDKKTEKNGENISNTTSSSEQSTDEKETTFQMQNTTYKIYDSNPDTPSKESSKSPLTTIKTRPEVSKVEKASYDKALGVDTKIVTNKQQNEKNKHRFPKKTPSKVEQQAYRPTLGQHQQTKRKLLMNVTLAEAMEKMNPTTPQQVVASATSTTKNKTAAVVTKSKPTVAGSTRSNTSTIEEMLNKAESSSEATQRQKLVANHMPGSALGCKKPLRLLYVIDVSEGMGRGTSRVRRWSRLKDFIQNINVNLLAGVEHQYMVYNIEPRILDSLDKCDRSTELFTIADDCLCNRRYQQIAPPQDGSGCSVNQPTQHEDMDDWGKRGPRAGKALLHAKQMYFNEDNEKYKNVILLLSHKQSADDIERIERNLKASGISLIDIELGQRHDLRRKKSVIPHPASSQRHKRSVVIPTHQNSSPRSVNNHGKTLLRKYSTSPSSSTSLLLSTTRKRNIIVPRKRAFIPIPQLPTIIHKKSKVSDELLRTRKTTTSSTTKSARVAAKDKKRNQINNMSNVHKQTNSVKPLRTVGETDGVGRRNEILPEHARGQATNKTTEAAEESGGEQHQDAHKVKVSLKKLTQTLKDIIGKVCTSNSDEDLNIRKRSVLSEFYF